MKLKKTFKGAYIALSVLMVVLGIAMLIAPAFFMYTLAFLAGAVCILHGIMRLAGYFSKDLYKIAFQFDLALGIASILSGCVLIVHADGVIHLIPVIIGMFTLVSGALRIQSALDAKRFGLSKWWILLVASIILIAFGTLLILCPFESVVTIVVLMGMTLIITGLQNIFILLHAVNYGKR